RLHARGPPPPVRGGGLGWGQSPTAAPQILASDTAPPRPSPACGGRSRACPAASTPVAPLPPSAVEGWGGGKALPPRRNPSRPTPPPPGLPPHAGEGAGPAQPPPRPWPPSPRPRWRVGGGAKSDRCAAKPRVGRGPHPGLPPHAGERGGRPSRLHSRDTPSPARGGGRGRGRTRPPATKRGPATRGAPAARAARRNSAAVAVRVARQRALDTVPRGTGRVARAVPLQARAPAAALVLGAQVRLGLLEVAVGEPRAAFVTGAVGRRIVLVA